MEGMEQQGPRPMDGGPPFTMGDTLGHSLRTAPSSNRGSPCFAASQHRGRGRGAGCLLTLHISVSSFRSGGLHEARGCWAWERTSPAHGAPLSQDPGGARHACFPQPRRLRARPPSHVAGPRQLCLSVAQTRTAAATSRGGLAC